MTLKSPFVSEFSICAIVLTESLHPDWFIVLFFSFLRFSLLFDSFFCLFVSIALFLASLKVTFVAFAFDLIFDWENPAGWHFFNYHSVILPAENASNDVSLIMARVIEIGCFFEVRIKFANIYNIGNPALKPLLGGSGVEINTFSAFFSSSRLSNYPFVKHIPIMWKVSSPDSFSTLWPRFLRHTSTHLWSSGPSFTTKFIPVILCHCKMSKQNTIAKLDANKT